MEKKGESGRIPAADVHKSHFPFPQGNRPRYKGYLTGQRDVDGLPSAMEKKAGVDGLPSAMEKKRARTNSRRETVHIMFFIPAGKPSTL
jgi:hypothetical protein